MKISFFSVRLHFVAAVISAIIFCLIISGCTPLLNIFHKKSLPPMEGEQVLPGLSDNVTVKRDNLGIPYIEAQSMDDLIFAMGYISACDRFTQMEGFRLVSQGRLSELLGKATLEMDIYLRALNLNQAAQTLYLSASSDLRRLLKIYSNGVNAYLANNPLPTTLKLAGHRPEPWRPIDSVYLFLLLTVGLSQNLQEEINLLNVAQVVEPEKLAWLFPIYPDEPLPFEEMKKLKGINLAEAAQNIEQLGVVANLTNTLLLPAAAASNNWAVSGKLTKSGKPIMANDTHLPLTMPSIWHMMHLKCPEIDGAGIAVAGVPGIIAGYNTHTGFGMTMVMADNQDIFLEKLQQKPDGLYYLYKNKWLKAKSKEESFRIKGQKKAITRTFYETIHGVLLNDILTDKPRHALVPMPVNPSLGIAYSWAGNEPDRSMDIFFNIMRAKSVDEILKYTSYETSIIPLNLVMADRKDIAWQVTGRFPLRKKGRGLCPSPGWTGEYDWNGFLSPSKHPSSKNPAKGYVGTANHRTVPADFPYILSSSWYYPDRGERIDQLLQNAKSYTLDDAKAMQLDTYSRFVNVIKAALLEQKTLDHMSSVWENSKKSSAAHQAIALLRDFDGNITADSAAAAFCGAFLFSLSGNLFADELGGKNANAYQSLLHAFLLPYSALHDHLTDRGKESPFWDDVTTSQKEDRDLILAKTVLDAVGILEKNCGKDPDKWQWGKLHTYHWRTDATFLADYMDFIRKTGVKFLSGYVDRGPYPAPGDHTTLNVSAYNHGRNFETWMIPAMRIIVDFGNDEPFIGINSTGQQDNPASPHYDDGITAFRSGQYQNFPFIKENIERQYTKTLTLVPKP